ncbi:tctex1 domain-containing protein 1-like, partial [Ooceraea biroi]|uniref:tctex1 domain-containing protein 1-like n=1 Tax=Ooceraea biroi TaxID=2015173 RepID=UPI000F097419
NCFYLPAQKSTSKVAWSVINKSIQSSRTLLSSISIVALHKGSLLFRRTKSGLKIPRYHNTYRLKSYNPFNCEVTDKILMDVMQNYLTNLKYQPEVCMRICQQMSAEVRDIIYKKNYDRYKVVVVMSIVQKLWQNVQIDFGKLWDVERDTYSTYVLDTPEFVAMGLVVGIYHE